MIINFWQDIPSLHQESLLRNLSQLLEVNLIVEYSAQRRKIEYGWSDLNFGNTHILLSPNNDSINEILSLKNSVNIFSGINVYSMATKSFKNAIKTNKIIGVQSESYYHDDIFKLPRKLRSKYHSLLYKNNINFLLAIGKNGVSWFNDAGFRNDKIFEFGYFTNSPFIRGHKPNKEFTFIFVGTINNNKGLDLLLKSLSLLKKLPWKLNVIGSGPLNQKLINLTKVFGLSDRVNFLGTMDNKRTIEMIEMADLLILPSKFKEGWGAVINEALMVGTPVLCSDICGAATLLNQFNFGENFKSKSIHSLTNRLKNWILKGSLSSEKREEILKWSHCIDGAVAAEYLIKIINHTLSSSERPLPPWSNL